MCKSSLSLDQVGQQASCITVPVAVTGVDVSTVSYVEVLDAPAEGDCDHKFSQLDRRALLASFHCNISTQGEFPQDDCTLQAEGSVYESPDLYLCAIYDPYIPDSLELQRLRPVLSTKGSQMVYGWTDGERSWPHWERPLYSSEERVVAWTRTSLNIEANQDITES